MSDSASLAGKVAVVTGAAGGIGSAIVGCFLERGAAVAAADLDAEGLERLCARYPDGERLRTARVDLTEEEDVDRWLTAVALEWGAPGIAVNCAGVMHSSVVTELSEPDWRRVFAVNVDAVFMVSRAVARMMVREGRGSIVTVSSNAGGVPRAGLAAYAASKAAATMFTRCLGLELAPHNIRCNIVAPGSTRTAMLDQLVSGSDYREVIAGSPGNFRTGIPLGRIGEPRDVAEAVAFLASDAARHITMADLYVDGGATLRG